ncbi:hypothetical protein HYZ78_01045 [Candidatus Microgenomates bacterium]|nr:hypothetical protein [Candidatus Microgenomates bacterium]
MKREIARQMLTLAISGFGLVSALAWNNVIQGAIDIYIKPFVGGGSTLLSQAIYAVIVTILAVTVTYYLSRFAQGEKK